MYKAATWAALVTTIQVAFGLFLLQRMLHRRNPQLLDGEITRVPKSFDILPMVGERKRDVEDAAATLTRRWRGKQCERPQIFPKKRFPRIKDTKKVGRKAFLHFL